MHTAPEVRKSVESAQILAKNMIQFVPLPVLSAEDYKYLMAALGLRLAKLEGDK